ncbi:MAG: signal recognition particle protein [Candidatus Nanopelagicaceae bacterium]
MFEALTERFSSALKTLRGKGRLSHSDIEEIATEIEEALLGADVAVEVAKGFSEEIKQKSLQLLEELATTTNPAQRIQEVINDELIATLSGDGSALNFAKRPPTIILLAGLQGAGKTSFAGKLARHLKAGGNTPLLVACDLQRPNAVSQLQVVAEQAGIPIFAPEPGNGVGNPVDVAKKSIEFAREKLHNMVIIDTAGRLGVDEAMMAEAAAIRDATSPHEILFVIDAMTGQDAARTARAFQEGVGITGIALTKLDGDARGGAALSVAKITGKPIRFAATGEKVTDFDRFHPERMASRILGTGDVATLAESAKRAFDPETAKRLEEKFSSGDDFTLADFLEQLKAMRKMGSMTKLLGMLPGAQTGAMKKQLESLDDNELVRTQSIIDSMTPKERNDVKILNGSRRARIARGSGRSVREVNDLVDRFTAAQKVMKQMRSGGTPQVPGLPVIPGSTKPKVIVSKKKSRSGNPAKRALEERG